MMSVTIDVTDIMFLAFVEQCEHYYELQPIDRGHHGPLARYVKLRVAHAPGMPGTFSPAADFKGNC